jgi:hypothetical protein
MNNSVDSSWSWFRWLTDRIGLTSPQVPSWASHEARFGDLLYGRPDESMSVADIPPELRRRLQEEAIRTAFHRLEMPLRFLMHATAPGRGPGSVQECQEILDLWRQSLEQEVRLTPDAYCGAVRSYEPAMERDYTIHGRCQDGEPLRIVIPCWRLHGETVVRGEAEPMPPSREGTPKGRSFVGATRGWGAQPEGFSVAPEH